MREKLNLKTKDGVEPSVLLKYGFLPKYDEDTGEIKEYRKKVHIEGRKPDKRHYTFVLYTQHVLGGIFRGTFYCEAWMSRFDWSSLCNPEALRLLYNLIIDGIVEPTEN